MSLTIELWEDTGIGPATSDDVNNLGWKSVGSAEAFPFYDYPVSRPLAPDYFTTSYTKYYYAKIYGTYANATRVRFWFEGSPIGPGPAGYDDTAKVRIYYRLTPTYVTPTDTILSGSYFVPGSAPLELAPFLSTTSPATATGLINLLNTNITYYTCYLATQLYVEPGAWNEFGNIGEVFLKCTVDEYESTDI